MINTILFDFDGTLMDTKQGIIDSWKYLFKQLTGEDVSEEFLKNTYGEPLKVSLLNFFPDVPLEETLEIYRSYQRDHHGEMMVPFDGVCDCIKALKEKGVKIGLVTSRLDHSAKEGLKEAGVLECFDALVTANMCQNHKPHPEPIFMALDMLGSKPEEAIMVGDTFFDMKAAKEAKVKSALVKWSENLDELVSDKDVAPDYVIENPMELLDLTEV